MSYVLITMCSALCTKKKGQRSFRMLPPTRRGNEVAEDPRRPDTPPSFERARVSAFESPVDAQ
jgi:hypothetical protein